MALSQGSSLKQQSLSVRRANAADAELCGRICFEAFSKVAAENNFPPDFPAPEIAKGILSMMFSHPAFFCIVAEQDGKLIGSNCLDERTPIAGVGPITAAVIFCAWSHHGRCRNEAASLPSAASPRFRRHRARRSATG